MKLKHVVLTMVSLVFIFLAFIFAYRCGIYATKYNALQADTSRLMRVRIEDIGMASTGGPRSRDERDWRVMMLVTNSSGIRMMSVHLLGTTNNVSQLALSPEEGLKEGSIVRLAYVAFAYSGNKYPGDPASHP